jgi:hypothetical protein
MSSSLLSALTLVFALTSSCAQKPPTIRRATTSVGDIPFDRSIDDSSFKACDSNRIFQYYNTDSWFLQHKDSVRQYFMSEYRPPPDLPPQSGYLTVKFIINCAGQTGRFRLTEMDSTYRPYHFDPRISSRLFTLVRNLTGWQPALYKGRYYDSYQYITFRIRNGHILTISP